MGLKNSNPVTDYIQDSSIPGVSPEVQQMKKVFKVNPVWSLNSPRCASAAVALRPVPQKWFEKEGTAGKQPTAC